MTATFIPAIDGGSYFEHVARQRQAEVAPVKPVAPLDPLDEMIEAALAEHATSVPHDEIIKIDPDRVHRPIRQIHVKHRQQILVNQPV